MIQIRPVKGSVKKFVFFSPISASSITSSGASCKFSYRMR